MKYELDILIDSPRDRVIELFDNTDLLQQWQPSLEGFRQLSGVAGRPGAKSELVHRIGRRTVTMIETVTARNFPDSFCGTYEAKGCWNSVDNTFEEISPNRTRWHVATEFKCTGMMWVMANLLPGAFKKETRKQMESFKKFVEQQD